MPISTLTITFTGPPARARRAILAGLAAVLAALAIAPAAGAAGWAIQSTANPAGWPDTFLFGVSCPSAKACLAVGNPLASGTFDGMDEFWNGTSWNIAFAQRLAGNPNNQLFAASCTSASNCEGVGYYLPTTGGTLPLAEVWTGSGWSAQPVQLPPGATGAVLDGVSCTSPNACTAVGFSFPSALTLIERWDGITWSVQQASTVNDTILSGVSCASASSCVAVGHSNGANFAESWDGTTWKPTLEGTFNGASSSDLGSVSCTSATACIAVGSYVKAGFTFTLGLSWTGSTWKLLDTPNLSATFNSLSGVSCDTANSCQAVGRWVDLKGETLTLAESWDGSNWSYQVTPNPAGTVPALTGVSCSSASACTAVGEYTSTSKSELTLAERFTAGGSPHALSLTRHGEVLALLRKPRKLELLVFKLGHGGRLLGPVALGRHPEGSSRIAWNLRVAGRRLTPGTYMAELVAAFGPGATSGGPSVTFKLPFPTGPVRTLSSTCSIAAASRNHC